MIGGLVYGFVVFMILPVYASLERMDVSLIEAGKDLYHGAAAHLLHRHAAGHARRAVRRHAAGVPAGAGRLRQRPAARRPEHLMIGNLIQQQFLEGQNWPLGSAMTVAMMAALTVLMVVYLRATVDPRQGAVDDARAAPGAQARFAVAVTVLFFAWLYLPILAVVLFSFNAKKSLSVVLRLQHPLVRRLLPRQRAARVARAPACVIADRRGGRLAGARHHAGPRPGADPVAPRPRGRRGDPAAAGHPRDRHRRRRAAALHRPRPEAVADHGRSLAEITFSIAYVTVIVRGRLGSMSPGGRGGRPRPRLHAVAGAAAGDAARARARRCSASGLLVFALVFDDFVLAFFTTGVDPQPLPVRIYSSIRFGVSPAINAVGTLMLAGLGAADRGRPAAAAPVQPQDVQPGPDHRRRTPMTTP